MLPIRDVGPLDVGDMKGGNREVSFKSLEEDSKGWWTIFGPDSVVCPAYWAGLLLIEAGIKGLIEYQTVQSTQAAYTRYEDSLEKEAVDGGDGGDGDNGEKF